MFFMEPDDAGGGAGGAPASATADPWEHSEGGGEGADNDPVVTPPITTPPAPVATIDPASFKAFGESFGKTFAETQRASAPQLPPTPEQLAEGRKLLQFMDIDDEFVKRFGNLDTQKQAFEQFRDGITQHIFTVFNHLRGNDRTELEKMFNDGLTPVRSMIEERQNSERQQKFTTRFSQFAAPEIAPHIEVAISQLASRDAFKGKSEADSFKLVAEHLAAQAKAYNPNFVLEDAEANGSSPSPSRSGNSLPVTSRGSGASRSGQPATTQKGWALTHMK